MKALKYFSIAALALLTVFSCNRKEVIEVGKPDVDGCQGVYFPAQLTSSSIMLDPSAPKTFKFKVARKESKGEFTVPLVVTDTAKLEKVFVVPEVKFADGQTETSFEVTFEKAKVGLPYALTIAVEDPLAVSTYTTNPTSIKVVFTVIEWKHKGEALVRDDILSSLFNLPVKYAEIKWDIYERGDKPGYYKFTNLFHNVLAATLGLSPDSEDCKKYVSTPNAEFYIDASDSTKVLIPYQNMGLTLTSNGEFWTGSVLPSGKAFGLGTLEGGIITFPAEGLVCGIKDKALYKVNGSGLFRVVLPGTVLVDYDFEIEVGENASDGNFPVSFHKGADVANIVYAAFEGKLNEEGLKDAVRKISKGEVASQKTTETKIALKFDKTGIYTLVALALNNKDEVVNTAAKDFGYIAAGEDKPVVLNYGLIVSDQYKHLGHTAENSMAFYVNGKEIKELRFVLIEASIYDLNQEAYQKSLVKEVDPQSAEALAAVNGKGLSNVFRKLSPGTEYVMLLAANNGYKTQIFSVRAKTAGKAKLAYRNFYFGALTEEHMPSASSEYVGTYNFYAKNVSFDESGNLVKEGKRSYNGKVKAVVHPGRTRGEREEKVDTLVFSGIFAQHAKALKVEDKFDVRFTYHNGFLAFVSTVCGKVEIKGKSYYTFIEPITDEAYSYGPLSGAIIGARPEKGVVAFYPEPNVAVNEGINFTSIAISAYNKPEPKMDNYLGVLGNILEIPVLIDPSVDDLNLAPEPANVSPLNLWNCERKPSFAPSLRENRMPSVRSLPALAEFVSVEEAPAKELKAVGFSVSKPSPKANRGFELRKDLVKF